MPEGSPIPGQFRFRTTPYLIEPLEAICDPRVSRVVFRKSAQIGWTDGVVLNTIGHRIDTDPCRILVLFPREKTAIDFNDEKLEPMIESVESLRRKVNLKSRAAGNRQLFKKYAGGFLKLIASNSPGDVKSTSAPIVIVEEPDDCNKNVKGQGDSIKMAEERAKAYHNNKIIIGGTPTIEDISAIDAEYAKSDKRQYFVACHECQEAAPLDFDDVKWVKDAENPDPVYGKHHPETAGYACPNCGALWNDAQKNRNVRRSHELQLKGARAGWIATAPFAGIKGFDVMELVSPFPDSRMEKLAKKFLDAHKKAQAGDYDDLITFTNSTLARSWKFASALPKEDELKARAERYQEFTIPIGAWMLVMGVDLQHDRIAIVIWAFGRGEEMWLVHWGEIFGRVVDPTDPVWAELDAFLLRTYRHATGADMFVEACSIDCGDGQTSDAAYTWVRRHKNSGRRVMAAKGPPDTNSNREVFATPAQKSIDSATPTKASRYGLRVYMVGNQKAQDLLLGHSEGAGRINLQGGSGPGRMHWYRDVRGDFYDQILSHVKAPWKGSKNLLWQKKAGKRDELLDGTILCLHAARALKSDRLSDVQWADREARLRQVDLLTRREGVETPAEKMQTSAPASPQPPQPSPARGEGDEKTEPVAVKSNSPPRRQAIKRKNWITGFRN